MKNNTKNITAIILTAGCFLAFFLFGFTDNLKGPTLPAMLAELNIHYGAGGNIFFGEYLGFLIATLITGILAERYGLKSILTTAGILVILGIAGYSTLRSAPGLGFSLFIVGLAFGAFELGANALIVILHPERKGLFLNLLGVLHGLGSTIAPIFAGILLAQQTDWRIIFRWDLLLAAFFLLTIITIRFPPQKETEKIDLKNIRSAAFQNNLPYYHIVIAFYVAAEISAASWMVTYLQQVRSWDVAASNQALSLFFAAIMAGRLIGGFIVQRIGYLRSILYATIGAFIFFLAGTLTPCAILLPISGLFLSIIFPTLTAAATDEITENNNTALGALFTFAGIGSLIGPWLVAWANELAGLSYSFLIVALFTATMIPFLLIIIKKGKTDGQDS